MLRRDGSYKFYRIQHLWRRDEIKEWVFSGFVDKAEHAIGDWKDTKAFSACGKVWQAIGEHGTESKTYALALCEWLTDNEKEQRFRVVRCNVTQVVTEEVLFA